jgi:thiol-disulfide isomerase/thioredoxin
MDRFLYIILLASILSGCTPTTQSQDSSDKSIEEVINVTQPEKKLFANGDAVPGEIIFTIDSTQVSTDTFKGKYLVINFWATWCSPCLDQTPIFNSIAKNFEPDQVEFITISINTEYLFWKNFILENEWNGNNYWIGIQETSPFFSLVNSEIEVEEESMILQAIPKYIIISPDGTILEELKIKPSNPNFEIQIREALDKNAT